MNLQKVFHTHRTRLLFFVRYGITGVAGGLIQTLFLYVWVSLLGLQKTYLLGLILGFIIALIVTFLLQKYWTFQNREARGTSRQLLLYGIVALVGLALNAVLLAGTKRLFEYFKIDFFHGWYLIVQLIIFCVVSLCNLCMNFFITFRQLQK